MPKIISLISRKGGTGKTTAAVNLATMLENLGHRVLLIETDTNYTLSTLRQLELHKTGAKDRSLFQILGSTDQEVVEELKKVKENGSLDVVIVDSAGKTTDTYIKQLCMVSDLVLIPTSLTQNDLLVTYQTVQDLSPALEQNESLQLWILANRVHSQTKMETIKEALAELSAEVMNHRIPMKNLFANSSTIMPEKEFLPIAKEVVSILKL